MKFAQVKADGTLGQVIDEGYFRTLYPSTLFPQVITSEHLAGFDDWEPVVEDPTMPNYDKTKQKIEQQVSIQNGIPTAHFVINDLTAEEQKIVVESQYNIIRYHRNNMLNLTDTWVLPDRLSKLSDADQSKIFAYRQALRDLPDVQDPFNIKYPTIDVAGFTMTYIVGS